MKLGRLTKVDLRDQWSKEDKDFTPWLAKEENIELLSDTIGIALEVQSQEENVGPFRADILCLDTINNDYVLIENQLERTDHTHLGQLMTYAAGLDAVTIVWIAQRFTDEHRAALDWLNNITDEKINFFGIEIELFKIGDSVPAPMFHLVAKPNDWTKSMRKSASNQTLTNTKVLQQEYWENFKTYMEESQGKIKMQKPQPQHWTNIAMGKSNFSLSASVSTRDNTISVWLNILGDNAKENFDSLAEKYLEQSKEIIDDQIQWQRLDERKQSAVVVTTAGDLYNRADWTRQFEWLKNEIELFSDFFKPKITNLN